MRRKQPAVTHLQLSWFLVYPLFLVFCSSCTFTHWLWSRSQTFCLFYPFWPASASPIMHLNIQFKKRDIYPWTFALFSFLPISLQATVWQLSYSLLNPCLTTSSSQWFSLCFTSLTEVSKVSNFRCWDHSKKTQVLYLFHYWGYCLNEKRCKTGKICSPFPVKELTKNEKESSTREDMRASFIVILLIVFASWTNSTITIM